MKRVLWFFVLAAFFLSAGVAAADHPGDHDHGDGDDGGHAVYTAQAFSSGHCQAGDTDSKCSGQPGDGWVSNEDAGPEQGAAEIGSWQYGYGGLNFKVPDNITFNDLTQLQTDFAMEWGSCVGGSPRWQINVLPAGTPETKANVANAANIQVYLGANASIIGDPCTEANGSETNTGNYIGTGGPGDAAPGRYDDSQISHAVAPKTYTQIKATYGSYEVVGIQLVMDGGWSQTHSQFEQEGVFDNIQVNNVTSYPDSNRNGEDADGGGCRTTPNTPC